VLTLHFSPPLFLPAFGSFPFPGAFWGFRLFNIFFGLRYTEVSSLSSSFFVYSQMSFSNTSGRLFNMIAIRTGDLKQITSVVPLAENSLTPLSFCVELYPS